MKKTNKILSLLLAVVMVFSAMSVSLIASAAIKAEGLLADPTVQFTQGYVTDSGNANAINATVALDYLDSILAEKGEVTKIDLKLTKITIDLTSTDGILKTLDLVQNVSGILSKIGSLSNLNTKNWKSGQTRKNTGDYDILKNLVSFLNDNKTLIEEIVNGKFKLGKVLLGTVDVDKLVKDSTGIDTSNIMGYILKNDGGVYEFLINTVAKLIYNYDKDSSLKSKYDAASNKKLDNILLEDGLGYALNSFLKSYDDKALTITDEEGLNGIIKFLYAKGFRLEGMLDTFKFDNSKTLDATIAQISDIIYSKNKGYIEDLLKEYGDELLENIKKTVYGAPFADELDFTPESYDFLNFTNDTNSVKGLNKFLGQYVSAFVKNYTGWKNTVNLGENLENFFMWAIDKGKAKGGENNPYADLTFTKGDFSTYAMAIAKMIVEATVKDETVVASLNKCSTVEQVVVKFLPALLNVGDSKVIGSKSKTVDSVLGDLLGSWLSKYTVMYTDSKNTKRYVPLSGTSYKDVLNYALNYFLVDLNFDTLLGLDLKKTDSVWTKLDKLQSVLFTGTKTLDYKKASKMLPEMIDDIMKLSFSDLVEDVVEEGFTNLNTGVSAPILAYSMLNNALKNVLGVQVFNVNIATSKTPLDDAVQNSALGTSVKNIVSGLNTRKVQILPVVLYIFTTLSDQSVYTMSFNSKKASVSVKIYGQTLKKGTHYNVTYKNDKAYVTGIGNYVTSVTYNHKHTLTNKKLVAATATKDGSTASSVCSVCGTVILASTKINKAVVSISKSSFTYTGKVQKPTVTVKDSSGKKISTSYYTVSYSKSCKDIGSYKVTVTFKGNYSGKVEKTFTIVPAATKSLKATKITASSVTLSWSKVTGAKTYAVYSSKDGKKWSKVATTSKTTYTATKLSAGTKYQFKVVPLNGKIEGSAKTVNATTITAAPSIKLTSTKKATATVTYKKVTGASSYVIYTSTNGKKWTKVATTKSTSYTLTKLSAGKKIYVKVAAVNSAKVETMSKSANVTVKK